MNAQTFILPLSTAMLVAMLLTACSEPQKNQAPVESPWAAVAKGSISIEGGIINIAAPRPGIVRKVEVEEGAEVKTGQVLARIDDREALLARRVREREQQTARQELKLGQIRLTVAERELRRLESLPGDDEVSRQDKDNARDQVLLARSELDKQKAALAVADAQVAASQLEVERHVVRAPQDGRIIRRQAKPGDGASTLNVTPLFQFAPNSPRIIRADLEERFLNAVQPGLAAEVTLEADDKKTYKARVLRLGQVFGNRPETEDPNEKQDMRIIECVLAIEAPKLRIGQRVIVRILRQNGAAKS